MATRGTGKGVSIVIGAEYNNADIRRAQRDLDALKREAQMTATPMQKLGSTLKSALVPGLAAAGAAAGYMALRLGVDAVKGALEEQKAIQQLRNTLDNLGLAMQLPAIETFIDNMQFATGVADDQLRPAMQRLVRATGDVVMSQQLLQLALDISASTGRDLGSVSAALSRAATGQTSALTRLGVTLSDSAKKSGNFALAVDELTARFQGSAAAAADTYQGKINRMTVAFGELQDSFGMGFLEGLLGAQNATDDLTQSMRESQQQAQDLGNSLGTLINTLGTIAGAYNNLTNFFRGFGAVGEVIAAGFTSPIAAFKTAAETAGWFKDELAGTDPVAQSAASSIEIMSGRMRSSISSVTSSAAAASSALERLQALPGWGGTGSSGTTRSDSGSGSSGSSSSYGSSGSSSAAKKVDPFKQFVRGLRQDAKRSQREIQLIAKGVPEDLARSIVGAPGWKKVTATLLDSNKKAIKKYIALYKRSPEALDAARAAADQAAQDAADAQKRQADRIERQTQRVQQRLAQFVSTVKDQFVSFASVARDFGSVSTFQPADGVPITARGISANLRQRLAMLRDFNKTMGELQRLGLSPQVRTDIFAMGPMDGLQYAKAILAGGKKAINEISTLTEQFNAPAVAGRFAQLGVEAATGAQAAALGNRDTIQVGTGAIQITVNGTVTALQRQEIEKAVRDGINGIGREARSSRKAGVR